MDSIISTQNLFAFLIAVILVSIVSGDETITAAVVVLCVTFGTTMGMVLTIIKDRNSDGAPRKSIFTRLQEIVLNKVHVSRLLVEDSPSLFAFFHLEGC